MPWSKQEVGLLVAAEAFLELFDGHEDGSGFRALRRADIAVSESLRPSVSRLEQMRLSALEDRIDARLALGHHAEVVPELRALTAEVPFRERLWSHLIMAPLPDR